MDPVTIDAVFSGSSEIGETERRLVLDALEPEMQSVGEPEAGPGPERRPERLSVRQRQLVGWRLYLHLRSTGLARRSLAAAAGVVEKTLDRILAIDSNVGPDTVAKVVAAAGLDLAGLLSWPPRDAVLVAPTPAPARGAPPEDESAEAKGSRVSASPAKERTLGPGGGRLAVGAVVVAMLLLAAGFLAWRPWEPTITLRAPIRVTRNEATVFGVLRTTSKPTSVVLYVRPENRNAYYRQATDILVDAARYQAVVRLGDERLDVPSLTFRVVAAAVEMGKEASLPGTFSDPAVEADDEEEFLRRLDALSMGTSDVVRVVRVAATPPRESVSLDEPISGARVESPVRVVWSPENLPLYVEIRLDAREVATASGPGRASGSLADLAPGRYELKLRRSPEEPILAVSHFEVVRR